MVSIEEQEKGLDLDLDLDDQSDRKYDKSWQTWVLFRHWQDACNIAWVVYFAFLLPLGISNLYATHPLCPYADHNYPRWYWNISYGVLGIWLFMWIALFMKLSNAKSMKERVPHLVAFNIISMSVVASILEMIPKWNGVCIDVLGVASSSNIWAEWIACGPLLVFITVALDHKSRLSRTDWVLMVSFAICMLTGFLIIIPGPYGVGVFWFAVSLVTFIPMLYLPYYAQLDRANIYDMPEEGAELIMVDIRYVQRQRSKLAMVLCISFSLFPVNYVLAWASVIDSAACIAVYRILSVITKGLFVVVTMDMHFDVLIEAEIALITVTDRKANEARRAFLKYIFHEVRSPLNSLSIGIEILSKSAQLTGEEDIESLNMMKDASSFINDTLNNVLSMQKIEEGKLDLDMSMFSLASCIAKVFATFRGNSIEKNILLTKHLSAIVPPQVLGDKYRIEHVIANLLGNAIKFSPYGSTIQVNVDATEPDAENVSVVTVSVVDHGMGISAEDQQRLFNDFVQIRPGQIQKGRGSGLGLAISKQIVLLHKGHIGVKSQEGQGSTFFFSIPFKVGSAEEADDGLSHQSQSAVEICVGTKPTRMSNFTTDFSSEMRRPLRVLIVDDSESNRKMLKMLLKKYDIPVLDTAEDGAQAVDIILLQGIAYDIVFMDNLMPIMNGVDATLALRQGGFESLLVGVTGNVLEEDMMEYLTAGADFIIPKPMRASTLHALIDFARREGCKSITGMRLAEHKSGLRWEASYKK